MSNVTLIIAKVYLVPGSSRESASNKRKTGVVRGSAAPEFNETLRYVLAHTDLVRSRLLVSVWHSDKFARNKLLGEASVALEPQLLTHGMCKWHDLSKRVGGCEMRGESESDGM